MFFIFLVLMFSEADTRSKFIDPKLYAQDWKEEYIVREWSFTDGCKLPGGKRSAPLFLDYLLKIYGQNLAIIEAKKYGLPVTEGLEQVKNYGKKFRVRWLYTSNGEEIYERDMQQGSGKLLTSFPSPEELYERYTDEHAVFRRQLLSIPYFLDSDKKPHYYQDLAITRVLSALAEGVI
jgi:glutamate rich protein grpB